MSDLGFRITGLFLGHRAPVHRIPLVISHRRGSNMRDWKYWSRHHGVHSGLVLRSPHIDHPWSRCLIAAIYSLEISSRMTFTNVWIVNLSMISNFWAMRHTNLFCLLMKECIKQHRGVANNLPGFLGAYDPNRSYILVQIFRFSKPLGCCSGCI